MTGTEIIRTHRHRYVVISPDGKNMVVNANGLPLILDSLPEAKNLACQVEGRWMVLSDYLKEFGN